jgi:hypothetical protein
LHPYLTFLIVVVSGAGVGGYALIMRDLVRRGRLHRRDEEMALRGETPRLPDGRVPCPECAEAILPAARRCPFCRSIVTPRLPR